MNYKGKEVSLQEISQKEWINPQELEILHGISLSTQAKLRMNRKIPFSKIGKFVKYSQKKINEWMEDNSVEVA